MKRIFASIIIISTLINPLPLLAETTSSNLWCTNVGNSTSPSPCLNSAGQCSANPSNPTDYKQSIITDFGVTMNGYDQAHLRWTWEKFCQVSGTRFNSFIRNGTINITTGISQQIGCAPGVMVLLQQFNDEELFKLALTHELGHVVGNCPGRAASHWSEYLQAQAVEDGVSYYARNAATCTGSDNTSEGYAEMIAYYLNPTTTRQTARCSPQNINPNLKANYPLHYAVAKAVLGDFN